MFLPASSDQEHPRILIIAPPVLRAFSWSYYFLPRQSGSSTTLSLLRRRARGLRLSEEATAQVTAQQFRTLRF
jgi:hypothetical protein